MKTWKRRLEFGLGSYVIEEHYRNLKEKLLFFGNSEKITIQETIPDDE